MALSTLSSIQNSILSSIPVPPTFGSILCVGDTNQSAYTSNPYSLIASSLWTVELWCYPTQNTTTVQNLCCYNQNTTGSLVGRLRFVWNNTTNVFQLGIQNNFLNATANSSYLNSWVHLAAVQRAGQIQFYVNGVLQGTVSITITADAGFMTIGRALATVNSGNAFYGNICMVRVSNSSLYISNFTPSKTYGVTANTQMFLDVPSNNFLRDSSTSDRTWTNNGLTFSSMRPT